MAAFPSHSRLKNWAYMTFIDPWVVVKHVRIGIAGVKRRILGIPIQMIGNRVCASLKTCFPPSFS